MRFLILCFISLFGTSISLATPCSKLLSIDDATSRLISYLAVLVDQRIIEPTEVSRFSDQLARGQISNPISADRTKTGSSAKIHRDEIDKHLRNPLDHERLKQWAQTFHSVSEKNRTDRENVSDRTIIAGFSMTFHKLVIPTLPYAIEIMPTPVTQKQWVDVMGYNPSLNKDRENMTTVRVRDVNVKLQPDNPVENVTWWSALEFANRISLREGLHPAYNLKFLSFDETTGAESGDLRAVDSYANLDVSNSHKSEGYRLPNLSEMQAILQTIAERDRFGRLHLDSKKYPIDEYAWHINNSESETHAVMSLKPMQIGGNLLYDLIGNVWEWTNDYSISNDGLKDGRRYLYGGSWSSTEPQLQHLTLTSHYPNRQSSAMGIRLVRTLK